MPSSSASVEQSTASPDGGMTTAASSPAARSVEASARVKPFGQQVYQAEFTQLGYFGASFLFHIINFFTKLRILYSFPKI